MHFSISGARDESGSLEMVESAIRPRSGLEVLRKPLRLQHGGLLGDQTAQFMFHSCGPNDLRPTKSAPSDNRPGIGGMQVNIARGRIPHPKSVSNETHVLTRPLSNESHVDTFRVTTGPKKLGSLELF
jgi:hypothetical protein